MNGLDLGASVQAGLQAFSDQGRINQAAATILTVSLLGQVVIEWRKMLSGHAPDWGAPILRCVAFALVLSAYGFCARSIIETVASLGDLQSIDPADMKKTVFAARAEAFSQSLSDEAGFSLSNLELSAASFVNSLLDVVTYVTFTLAAACVFILKVIQKVMLSSLLALGPIMIAVSSIPGVTRSFMSSWAMGLIEVTAWGVVAKIFLAMLVSSERSTTINPNVTQNLAEHICFNVVYGTSFLVIPLATSSILRGGGAAGLALGAMSSVRSAASGGTASLAHGLSAAFDKARRARAKKKSSSAGDAASGPAATADGQAPGTASRAGDKAAGQSRGGSAAADEARRAAIIRERAIRKQERKA